MHVLFIADGDDKYGASQSMKQLISGMLEYCENIEISVVLPLRVDLEDFYHELGCHTYKILYEPFYQGISQQRWKAMIKFLIRGVEYFFGKCLAVSCLNKRLDMNTIDIIHSNSSREDFSAALALKYHKPLVWHIREFGDKDYRCFSYRRDYIQLMNKAATEFIAVSDAVKNHWIEKGLDREKIIRIYNSTTEMANVKKQYKKNCNEKIKFVILGCICETKGQYQIIQALELMSDQEREKFSLDIVGDGTKSYIRKLGKRIEDAGLSYLINFLGYRKDFSKSLSEYDCGIICSKSEGFGRVTIEYMMAGIPVIASDTGANKELIIDNENGLLYKWNDALDLREKIVYLLNNSTEELGRMGKRAREIAISHFSIKQNIELVYNEYLKVIKNSSKKIEDEYRIYTDK